MVDLDKILKTDNLYLHMVKMFIIKFDVPPFVDRRLVDKDKILIRDRGTYQRKKHLRKKLEVKVEYHPDLVDLEYKI